MDYDLGYIDPEEKTLQRLYNTFGSEVLPMWPVRSVTHVSGLDPCIMERAMGIEPTSEAWEASILPLYDARSEPNPNRE